MFLTDSLAIFLLQPTDLLFAVYRCQHCTGALMYECGEIKRVTRQTGGGWKGETSVPRESSCTSASRCYHPSLPSSITLPFCLFLLLLYTTYLFICLYFFISISLLQLPIWCHGRGHSPNKVQRSQRENGRNKETAREHSYSENISISLRNTN